MAPKLTTREEEANDACVQRVEHFPSKQSSQWEQDSEWESHTNLSMQAQESEIGNNATQAQIDKGVEGIIARPTTCRKSMLSIEAPTTASNDASLLEGSEEQGGGQERWQSYA